MIHLRRLLKGFIYIGVTYLFMLNFGEIEDSLRFFFHQIGYDNTWNDVLTAFCIPIFGYFCVGFYFIYTFYVERNPVFERPWKDYLLDFLTPSGPSPKSMQTTNNIEKMVQYRDSVLAGMSYSDGASEYMKTAWLDGVAKDSNNHTNAVTQYVNSKLAAMSYSEGYEWLKNQASK